MQNCHVVLADRDEHAMIDWTNRVLSSSNNFSREQFHIVPCDVTQSSQVLDLIQQADHLSLIPSSHDNNDSTTTSSTIISTITPSPASFLVNCAGITRDNWVSNISLTDWDDVMNVNLKGTFLTCQHFLHPQRLKQQLHQPQHAEPNISSLSNRHSKMEYTAPTSNAMSIVNIGSIVSEYGNLGQANYAASKGGVLGLTRALAKESARWGVRVNAVLPGFIDTPMVNTVPQDIRDTVILPKIPMGRLGKPEEIADTVAFSLSPRSSYTTGEAIRVSGMISL